MPSADVSPSSMTGPRSKVQSFLNKTGLNTRKRQFAAVAVVLLLIAIGWWAYLNPRAKSLETGKATIDDLLSSTSERSGEDPDMVVVALDQPFMTLAATPVALYYGNDGMTRNVVPLLVAGTNPETQDGSTSTSITGFAEVKGASRAAMVGPAPDIGVGMGLRFTTDSPEKASEDMARAFWARSDGALLVSPDEEGYAMAVPIAPAASYLNIPIIITKDAKDVEHLLGDLEVKYTLVAGDLKGYKKVWHIGSAEEAQDILAVGCSSGDGAPKSILKDRMAANVSYITMANPLDIHRLEVLDEFTQEFEGQLTSKSTGSVYMPTSDDPGHVLTIPDDYRFARVILESNMPFVQGPDPRRNPEKDGERSYTYFGLDRDQDGAIDEMEFMSPSLAYENENDAGHSFMAQPVFNRPGDHLIQIAGTLYTQFPENVPKVPNPTPPPTTTYTIKVTVQKLADDTYPYMNDASSMAPYLTAYHQGVILAKPGYGVQTGHRWDDKADEDVAGAGGTGNVSCSDCWVGMEGPIWDSIISRSNNQSAYAKEDLNALLARLAGLPVTVRDDKDHEGNARTGYMASDLKELASAYKAMAPSPMLVAVTGDTNMVPWYYYPTSVQADQENEGYGVPSDNAYADIDLDMANAPFDLDGNDPTMELGIGRLLGWDVQDESALIARTVFYKDIIDTFSTGIKGQTWKESALTSFGSKVPVEFTLTVSAKLNLAWRQSGFTPYSLNNMPLSDSAYLMPFYEKSNFIYFCAHGFFYWYVPPGYQKDAVGGGFYVANVKDMKMGPSVIFASSCVTGRIDRLHPYNTISQTYIHAGANAYIGASRLSFGWASITGSGSGEIYGSYLGLLMYGYMTGYKYDRNGGLITDDGSDLPMGAALMMAKNKYTEAYGATTDAHADTVEEFYLFGDPAFNPYEPNHDG